MRRIVAGCLSWLVCCCSRPLLIFLIHLLLGTFVFVVGVESFIARAVWCVSRVFAVVIAVGKRPVPFRTRKLSLPALMVLHSIGCGRVSHRRNILRHRSLWVVGVRGGPSGLSFARLEGPLFFCCCLCVFMWGVVIHPGNPTPHRDGGRSAKRAYMPLVRNSFSLFRTVRLIPSAHI